MSLLDWTFLYPERVHLIWLALALVIVLLVLELRARNALASFLSPVMQSRLAKQTSMTRTIVRLVLIFLCFAAGIGALMRPRARGATDPVSATQVSADVMFVLDTSRSMLADDASPNRLARAKAEIGNLVTKLAGQRVGLTVFAGRAVQMCPLTPDHAFFNTVLSTVDTRSAGRGGTRIGEALKTALRGFPPEPGAKLIVLITDGDDQDPYSQEAAKAARDAGVKIVAVGLGSETGSEIRLTDPKTGAKTTLMYDGKPVISKLDGEALRNIALTTEGAYIPAGTSAIDLESIMDQHVRPIVNSAADTAVRYIPSERYAWLVLLSLAFLLASVWVGANIGERR